MIKVGILNSTGYAGAEVIRILQNHPEVTITAITGRSAVGQKINDVFPHLVGIDLTITSEISDSVDIVFSALPHKASAEKVSPFLKKNVKVIDISADFRLKDLATYETWYKTNHPSPEYLTDAVYGLPELHRKDIAKAQLIANPGCYPTSAILAMAPAISEGIIHPDIIIDSKSGTSGAGRGLSLSTHFSEVNENFMAYSLDGHRHLPEILQELNAIANADIDITFLTHLAPMTRGILSTCYAQLKDDAPNAITDLYNQFYLNEPFVKITKASPQTKQTLGSNFCLIHPFVDQRTNRLIVISCIDNLIKGAGGQAVQNMNLMLNFPETMALEGLAIYP